MAHPVLEKRMEIDPATGDIVFVDTEPPSEIGLPDTEPVPEITDGYPAESDHALT